MAFLGAVATIVGTLYLLSSHQEHAIQFMPVLVNQQSAQAAAIPQNDQREAPSSKPTMPIAAGSPTLPGLHSCAPTSQDTRAIVLEANAYYPRYPNRALDRYRCAESRLPAAFQLSAEGAEIRRLIDEAKQGDGDLNLEAVSRLRELFNRIP